jgi:hypothetical protein
MAIMEIIGIAQIILLLLIWDRLRLISKNK